MHLITFLTYKYDSRRNQKRFAFLAIRSFSGWMASPILFGHDQLVSHPPGGRIQRYFFRKQFKIELKLNVLSVSLNWLVVRLNTKFAKFFIQANVLLTRQVAGFFTHLRVYLHSPEGEHLAQGALLTAFVKKVFIYSLKFVSVFLFL